MHDADDGDVRTMVLDRLVEGDLRILVERAGSFVEEEQAGFVQQDARDDQLLLLTARGRQTSCLRDMGGRRTSWAA